MVPRVRSFVGRVKMMFKRVLGSQRRYGGARSRIRFILMNPMCIEVCNICVGATNTCHMKGIRSCFGNLIVFCEQ